MRTFSARETEWMMELDGIELASFQQRAAAFVIDWIIIGIIFSILASGVYVYMHRHGKTLTDMAHMVGAKENGIEIDPSIGLGPNHKSFTIDEHSDFGETMDIITKVLIPILYFGILLYRGKGRTPGKRLMKIRVVSIVHRHLSFWHCVERALGYGAAALEGGFGFIQFFIHPYRRCAQDRLAETMVVTERGYQLMQHKRDHPLVPDTAAAVGAPE